MDNYLKGRNEPKTSGLVAISKASGLSVEWLAIGDVEKPVVNDSAGDYKARDYALVSHGIGDMSHKAPHLAPLAFSRAWLDREGLSADQLALIQAQGYDMAPTISRNDLLLVDFRVNIAGVDWIYAIKWHSHHVVKRVQSLFDGPIYIRSDNEAYQTQALNP